MEGSLLSIAVLVLCAPLVAWWRSRRRRQQRQYVPPSPVELAARSRYVMTIGEDAAGFVAVIVDRETGEATKHRVTDRGVLRG